MGVVSVVLVVLWLLPLTSGQNQTAKSPASTMSALPGSSESSESTTEKPPNATTPSDSTGTPSTADEPTQTPTSLSPTTSTGPLENQTASTSPVPHGTPRATPKTPRATPETPRATPKTPRATPKTPRATPETPRATPKTPRATPKTPRATPKTPRATPETPKTPDGSHHGRVAAGLIGGALLVMPVGFLLIYIKKRRLQKQQMETGDWAGPSPFLGGGASGPAAAQRPSNRNSLAVFLRLSRRPSALLESGEEFVTVTTFGRKGSSLL